ncbi:hypothetical protein BDR07DRAFT_1419918 [Suillus spraguei]|nr:hypothetical protein BDR07DRAFT_1419918 [Suillus spraguei]
MCLPLCSLSTAIVMVDVQESPEALLAILQNLYPRGAIVPDSPDSRRYPPPKFHERSKSKRTIALLDAVAAISVQDARHQIVAVSITLKQNNSVIHITSNRGVGEETLSHLRHIFVQLKLIRSSLAQPLAAGTENLDTSTSKQNDETCFLKRNLLQSIYVFSWRKFRQHEEMKESNNVVFPLRRYLLKVFSLSYHYQSLLTNLAYPHRMGHVLDTLIIERIDPVSESNTFTLSKDIIQQIVVDFGLRYNNSIEEGTSSIVSSMPLSFVGAQPSTQSVTNDIHCEALLLRHHFLNPTFPPFNYIAVSKLSCYACCALFDSFNRSVGRGHKYFVKSCHRKLYPNWILPNLPSLDSSIRRRLVEEQFGVALTEFLWIQLHNRWKSDSTGKTGEDEDEWIYNSFR